MVKTTNLTQLEMEEGEQYLVSPRFHNRLKYQETEAASILANLPINRESTYGINWALRVEDKNQYMVSPRVSNRLERLEKMIDGVLVRKAAERAFPRDKSSKNETSGDDEQNWANFEGVVKPFGPDVDEWSDQWPDEWLNGSGAGAVPDALNSLQASTALVANIERWLSSSDTTENVLELHSTESDTSGLSTDSNRLSSTDNTLNSLKKSSLFLDSSTVAVMDNTAPNPVETHEKKEQATQTKAPRRPMNSIVDTCPGFRARLLSSPLLYTPAGFGPMQSKMPLPKPRSTPLIDGKPIHKNRQRSNAPGAEEKRSRSLTSARKESRELREQRHRLRQSTRSRTPSEVALDLRPWSTTGKKQKKHTSKAEKQRLKAKRSKRKKESLKNEIDTNEFVYTDSREANRRPSVRVVEQTNSISSKRHQLERDGDSSRPHSSNSNDASQQFQKMISFLAQPTDKELTELELHGYERRDMKNYSQAGVELASFLTGDVLKRKMSLKERHQKVAQRKRNLRKETEMFVEALEKQLDRSDKGSKYTGLVQEPVFDTHFRSFHQSAVMKTLGGDARRFLYLEGKHKSRDNSILSRDINESMLEARNRVELIRQREREYWRVRGFGRFDQFLLTAAMFLMKQLREAEYVQNLREFNAKLAIKATKCRLKKFIKETEEMKEVADRRRLELFHEINCGTCARRQNGRLKKMSDFDRNETKFRNLKEKSYVKRKPVDSNNVDSFVEATLQAIQSEAKAVSIDQKI